MALTGMNVAEVRHLADQLRRGADNLHGLVSAIDGRVHSTNWTGQDADRFKHQWWPGHRQAVLAAAEAVGGLARSASNNADEQERASAANGAAGSAGTPAPGGAVGRDLLAVGRFVGHLKDDVAPVGAALGVAGVTALKFFDDVHSPAKNILKGVAENGAMRVLGHAMTVVAVGVDGYQTYQDLEQQHYVDATLDGIDTAADVVKDLGPEGYVAGVVVQIDTDGVRAAREIDWHPDSYSQYMNPLVAENWRETILPGAAQGLSQLFGDL